MQVESVNGATLDGVAVDNTDGTIAVDSEASPDIVTLTLDDGTVITEGDLNIGGFGVLEVSGDGATLDDVSVDNSGTVQIDNGSTLLLDDGTTISGGDLDNAGQIDVSASGNALHHEAIANTGTIEVLAGGVLTIDQVSTVDNTGGHVSVDGSGKLMLNAATITAGTVANGGEIDLAGTAVIQNGTLGNSNQIKVTNGGNALESEIITNTGTIEVLSGGALTIDLGSNVDNTNGHVTVDGGGLLTLNAATVAAGTVINNGEIALTGSAIIKNGTLDNSNQINVSGLGNALHKETITNTGTIEVAANGVLTIDQTSTIDNTSGDVTVDGYGKLTLNAATITAGMVTNGGGNRPFRHGGAAAGRAEQHRLPHCVERRKCAGQGNHHQCRYHRGASGGALTIDQVSSIDNTNGHVTVDGDRLLTLNAATITARHGDRTMARPTLPVRPSSRTASLGNSNQINVSGIGNALDKETVTNTGTIEVVANGALTIDQVSSIDNTNGTITVTVDGSGALKLNATTITARHGDEQWRDRPCRYGRHPEGHRSAMATRSTVSGLGNALHKETVTNTGTIEVAANGALTIDQVSSIDNTNGHVTVDGSGLLKLNATTITARHGD